ncbi:phosphoribosylaminoimidazolesuccinocarboxamide synthase [Legionella israelensis]|uniref:phosphoribosylaminoimidazolesuccinocarboxamide synthase n=1 Tax=Legionella israelensis TaxID=454 RepID=UPI00117D4A07|nr:phosphoribosylaminoimidazolesuccinocarboxamide synthase [Legionella israelensis]QDP72801.1 phosphoribosylaminoimidazolesuccinocarboxamide synthase [Legionella israelensis]
MPMTAISTIPYKQAIEEALPHCLTETAFNFGHRYQGKVRDTYDIDDRLILITTDRQSAFDRLLAAIPYKGQVLNLTSAWWFEQTQHLIPNHLLAVPDPNVSIVKKCSVFPIEFVVRGYITGTTNTSLWTQYKNGARQYCGHHFGDGLRKNQQLLEPVITPTTKEKEHDRPISPKEIIAEGLMREQDWQQASQAALTLFHYGTKIAAEHGLILVDTKYEFGKDENGNIILVDELHTPDSSRYWLAENYQERFMAGLEPENIDKEFLRLWFVAHCDPYHDKNLPEAPKELIITLSERYIQLYEMITGKNFLFSKSNDSPIERIEHHIKDFCTGSFS